jgi:hypothetical protein
LRLRIASCSGGRRSPATEAVQPTGAEYQSHCMIWFGCCHPKLPSWNLGAIARVETGQYRTASLVDLTELLFEFGDRCLETPRRFGVPSPSQQFFIPHDLHFEFDALIFVGHGTQFQSSVSCTMEPQICFPPSRIQKPRRPCARSRPVGASPGNGDRRNAGH